MSMIQGGVTIIGVVAVIVIAATVYGYYFMDNSGVGGNPGIQVTPGSYDFGTIPKEAVSHTFEVKNTGTAPLEIRKVSTSCACTTASIDSEEIAPGQSADMIVTFDPNVMESIEENVFRIVYIKTNDPQIPEVEVEIRAKVIGGSQ